MANNPGFYTGEVPTAAQWDNAFSAKVDVGGDASSNTVIATGGNVAQTLSAIAALANDAVTESEAQGIATYPLATIAAIRALTSSTAITAANVASYATPGDQGGGIFVVDANDTTTADNGGTIIVDAAGRRWYRQYETVAAAFFGVSATSSASSNLTNLQAAITACPGATIILPAGTININGLVTISNGVTIKGAGVQATILQSSNLTTGVLSFTSGNGGFSGLTIQYTAQATASSAVYSSSSNLVATDFLINYAYVALEVTSGSAQFFGRFQLQNYANIGFFAHAINDVYSEQFIINAGSATNGANGGINLAEKAEAIVFSGGDVLLGVSSLVTSASTNAAGSRPAYCNFSNVFFDSAAQGAVISDIVESEFVGCWFSAGRSGTGYPGLTINTADSLNFIATRFFNNGSHGCVISANAVRTMFNACNFESNSVTAGAGVAHGLAIAAGATDFSVIGCVAHNGLYTGQQGYGIIIEGGASDAFSIIGCDLGGNYTGALSDGSTGATKTITGNAGYALGNVAPTVGASPWTYTNTSGAPQTVAVFNGTVSSITLSGSTVFVSTNQAFVLPQGQGTTITYSAAPNVVILNNA